MANLNYSEKLKDPRWQKKRLEILERDRWTCKSCGEKEKTLHVHHIFYFPKKDPWEIHNGFLITFCEDCHRAVGCEGKACAECDDFGIDCDGCRNSPKEIQEDIGTLLNKIWETDKEGDFCSSLGVVWSEVK